jgi:hypothetical protein
MSPPPPESMAAACLGQAPAAAAAAAAATSPTATANIGPASTASRGLRQPSPRARIEQRRRDERRAEVYALNHALARTARRRFMAVVEASLDQTLPVAEPPSTPLMSDCGDLTNDAIGSGMAAGAPGVAMPGSVAAVHDAPASSKVGCGAAGDAEPSRPKGAFQRPSPPLPRPPPPPQGHHPAGAAFEPKDAASHPRAAGTAGSRQPSPAAPTAQAWAVVVPHTPVGTASSRARGSAAGCGCCSRPPRKRGAS